MRRDPIRYLRALCVTLFAVLALSGCAGMGTGETTVPVQDGRPILSSTDRQLADAYNRLHAARTTIAQMAARKRINDVDRRSFEAEAMKIRRNLDFAVAAGGAGGGSQVELALNALLLLEARLRAKEGT